MIPEVNPSAPQHKCWGLLRVDPERRFFTPPSKAGLGAAEWVRIIWNPPHPVFPYRIHLLLLFDLLMSP